MPIEVGIWRLGQKLERVSMSSIETEARLEEMLVADISILNTACQLRNRFTIERVSQDFGIEE